MKYLLLISALVAVTLARHADVHGEAEVHKKCQSEPSTQVAEEVFEKLKRREKVDLPANFGKHVQCMAKGLNLIHEDGKVNVDGVKTHVQHVITDSHDVEEIVQKCAVNKETSEKTAGYVQICLRKKHIFGGGDHDHHHHQSSESNESQSNESHDHHHGHH